MQHLAIFIQHGQPANLADFFLLNVFLTATNLKDIRMSLILENKILKKETLKTTRKSSLHLIPCERFHLWRLVLRRLEQYPALRQEIPIRSPPLDLAQTDFHLKYDNFPHYR